MTSLKTDHLPHVVSGMIWDGVTEYQNVLPPGVVTVYLLRMYGDCTHAYAGNKTRMIDFPVKKNEERT